MVTGTAAVIKRAGHTEPYDASKLHGSIVRACREVRVLEGEAALIADRVAASVTEWIREKTEVTSRDIRSRALPVIGLHHAEAAYAYDVHDAVL